MASPRQAAMLWSGGKDSALALYSIRTSRPDLHVDRLVTCLSQAYDRVSMHGVRRRLIEQQAESLELPVDFIIIPPGDGTSCPLKADGPGTSFPPNDVYGATMHAALTRLRSTGVEAIIFGDIYLEDLRAYRDRLLADVGLEGVYPL